jgi:RNA polymerase sigma-70 factor (ECF subfamily)
VQFCADGWEGRREARASYEAELTQARQEPERRFLERRLSELRD